MRYRIRRIAPGSALRVGCALGWLVALLPALCAAGLVVQVLRQIDQAFGRIAPIDISVLGQRLAHIDLLEILGLSTTAQTVGGLTGRLPLTFVQIALALTIVGAVVLAVVVLLFSAGYNLLASMSGGLEVELREAEETDPRAERS